MSLTKANHDVRHGRFTSSQIHKLIKSGRGDFGFGAPALTYIDEKRIERKMKSSLDVGGYSPSMAWGNFMERVLFEILGLEYQHTSDETKAHPDPLYAEYWAGSCDLIVEHKKIAEIKCYQKKKFAEYAECLQRKDLDFFKKNFPDEYWQIVSNCIINEVPNGEAILYMPYESEMTTIREMVQNYEGPDMWKYRFIIERDDYELAVLPDDSGYENLNRFEFVVPKEDIALLHERVDKAVEILTK